MSEARTIRTILEMRVNSYVASAKQAEGATRGLAKEIRDLEGASSSIVRSWDRVGNTFLTGGAAIAAALGLAGKAAMDWESAWAGVQKTVDGSAGEMAALEQELRDLAKTLPATHEEIAAVAEAAGQLGVATPDVDEFTKTMIDLGETTNLTADEAATSLARFSEIMGTSTSEVDNLGASLVGLGNNFATTESEILAMAMRLAGTGKQMRMTEGDVLGIAAAMSSVGIEAEAGGTSMSLVMKKIDAAVRAGGAELEKFATAAGVSATDFADAWRDTPSQALLMLTKGMSDTAAEGKSMNAVLDTLGITGIRESDTMLRLAASHDQLAAAIASGNDEYAANTALLEEANKRYATAESQAKIALNSVKDSMIDFGASLLPIIADGANVIAGLANAFSELPAPAQEAVVTFGLLASAGMLATGGLMKLIPAAQESIAAFRTLNTQMPRAAAGIRGFGLALGAAGIAYTLSAIGHSLNDFTLSVEELSVATTSLADTANPLDTIFGKDGAGSNIEKGDEFARMLNRIANPDLMMRIDDMGTGLIKLVRSDAAGWSDATERIEAFGSSLAQLSKTDFDEFKRQFRALWETGDGSLEFGKNLIRSSDELRGALTQVADANGLATDESTLLTIALGMIDVNAGAATDSLTGMKSELTATEQEIADTASSAEDLNEALQEMAGAFLGSREASRRYAEELEKVAEVSRENAGHWEDGTEGANANAEALDGLAEAGLRNLDAMQRNGEASSGTMQELRDQLYETALSMGATEQQAEQYVTQLGLTPEKISTQAELDTEKADATFRDWVAKMQTGDAAPSILTEVGIETKKAEEEWGIARAEMQDEAIVRINTELDAEEAKLALAQIPEVQEVLISPDTAQMETEVDKMKLSLAYLASMAPKPELALSTEHFEWAAEAAEQRLVEISGMTATPELDAEKTALERVIIAAKGDLASVEDKTVTVTAETEGESKVRDLGRLIAGLVDRTVSVAVTAQGMSPRANGGRIAPGRSQGGWVPGPYPGAGVDNVLWPVAPGAYGGRFLSQPLAGTEFVVNPRAARQWAGQLEQINAGQTPTLPGTPGPLIGSLTVTNTEGQTPREQGQFIAAYLGSHINI